MKKFKGIIVLVLALALIAVALCGCGQTDTKTASTTERTVVDMAGRTVTLPEEINSIGTFGSIGVINTFVELMGEGDKICNDMSASFTKTDQWKYQYVFAPQIKGAPIFENASREIQMEEVLKTKPDLCIAMSKDVVAALEAQGLNVIYLEWNNSEDVKQCVTLLGEVFNKQDVAKDYISYFDEMVAKAAELTKGISDADQKAVLYGNIAEFTQPHVIAEWWIPKAGGISVTDNGRTDGELVYTFEDILKWNPDTMVFMKKSSSNDILSDKRLANINAIKNNAIYYIPTVAHVWGNRTPEQPLTIMWMMNKLYPEIKSYDDLAGDIKYFYSHFFNYNMSDKEIAEIIS
jgi:iron complex transport system substrate-binding protein